MTESSPLRVVAAAIFDSKNRILLAEKPVGHKNSGLFEFPGGKVGKTESDSDALKREIQEELNLLIQVEGYLGDEKSQIENREIHLFLYRARLTEGDAGLARLILSEHQSVVWSELKDLSTWPLCDLDRKLAIKLNI